jgi:hypothetical protein
MKSQATNDTRNGFHKHPVLRHQIFCTHCVRGHQRFLKVLLVTALAVFAWGPDKTHAEENGPRAQKNVDPQTTAWEQSVTTGKGPGKFAELPSLRLTYKFGWSTITAAKANIDFESNKDSYTVIARGATTGLPRTLFPLDVVHYEKCSKRTLQPISLNQDEKYRTERVQTKANFQSKGVTTERSTIPAKEPTKTKDFNFSPVFDLESALFWIRSQPLNNGEKEVMVVFPTNSPYLATITVLGREKIRVAGQERNAIKLDLQLKSIDKHLHLRPHKKFRNARGWISDDNLRIPLRLDANIFIGSVFTELQSVSQ